MAKQKPLINRNGEVRVLTDKDFAKAVPFSKLPKDLQVTLRGLRGPQKTPTKQLISIRLPADVLARWKATGPGWQTRLSRVIERARVG